MSEDDQRPTRYLRLAEARALECNGCGDCCDSRRTDGYWTWGHLPEDGFASRADGVPLIIPLVFLEGEWRDRPHALSDLGELSGTRFRCAAFVATPPSEQHPEGGGSCARHDRWRPDPCHQFPVGAPDLEVEVARLGEVPLETSAFPRCTWYRVTIVRDDDPRAAR
ncbi:MAG: hypothetical protein AB7F65_09750 [Dehalococcoidia bacterium]